MRYICWLFAVGCLAATAYVSETGHSDVAVLGWILATIGGGPQPPC